jgi:AbrB family looped-hinge helix DNA binding protein
METVKLSPKYQVVIPRSVRDFFKMHPGEMVHVLRYQDRIELIPEKSIKSMRGFAKGIDTTMAREKDRL